VRCCLKKRFIAKAAFDSSLVPHGFMVTNLVFILNFEVTILFFKFYDYVMLKYIIIEDSDAVHNKIYEPSKCPTKDLVNST
jgi:hypothetical protein